MPQNYVDRFAERVTKGFNAVGCRIPVTKDTESIVVRDVFVEFRNGIQLYRAGDPDQPFASFPEGAEESAASTLCVHILSGIVARAVEE